MERCNDCGQNCTIECAKTSFINLELENKKKEDQQDSLAKLDNVCLKMVNRYGFTSCAEARKFVMDNKDELSKFLSNLNYD